MGVWPIATRGDSCVSMFGAAYDTGLVVFPQQARVLEIGCAEGDWQTPMLSVRPDLQITGIDWRACERPGTVIQGDVLTHDFPDASFDAVVGVSSIEHIGLGHYDRDPVDVDGDTHAMQRAVRWLKPGGLAYFDVPWAPEYKVWDTSHRAYDEAALRSRLLVKGLRLLKQWYTIWALGDHALHDSLDYARQEHATGGFVYVACLAMKEGA